VILADVAHSRAGDKGTVVNISVIVFDQRDYAWIAAVVTADRVRTRLGPLVDGGVTRYELPTIGALNFVFTRMPGQSVTRTLELDAHGKTLSAVVLSMALPERPQPAAGG
jgi:hypothetical protein